MQLFRPLARGVHFFIVAAAAMAGTIVAHAQFWQQDSTFAPKLESPALPLEQKITDLARQPDGKLLVAGYVEAVNGQTRADATAPLRFNADGTVDPSFQATGPFSGLFLQPSGKIVTAEGVRLNANGSVDASFHLPEGARQVVAVDPLGRVYAWRGDSTLLRTSVDGVEDSSFRPAFTLSSANAIAPFADGSVAIASMVKGPYYTALTMLRLRPDGTEDTGFQRYALSSLLGLAALPDGKVLVYGQTQAQNGIALRCDRLGLDGVPDYTYISPASNSSAPTLATELTLAGVLYDLLQDAHATAGTHVQTAFSTGGTFTGALDVSVDGSLWLAETASPTPGRLARYTRSSATGLTIDPKPSLLSDGPYSPVELRMGESTWFAAPAGGGLFPLSYQWNKDGSPIPGATTDTLRLTAATAADAGGYTVTLSNAYGSVTTQPRVVSVNTTPSPVVVTQPLVSQAVTAGSNLLWWIHATGNPYPTFAWTRNGSPIDAVTGSTNGEAASSVQITSGVQPEHTGIYEATVTSGESSRHMTAILGVLSDQKTVGSATEVGTDIVHPNKNVYDQVLLTGPAAAITADAAQVTRISFVDLTNDIVQVELSGAGTLALVLDNAGAPSPPVNYNQPNVSYVRGHPGIVVAGADETTNIAIFSVGRANAVNQALFRDDVNYDGMADVAFLAISSTNGRFGSLRAGNVQFYGHRGLTGLYAPGVVFAGPVYVGNIDAFDAATPVLVLDGAADLRIAGGDLLQTNGQPVRIGQLVPRNFTAGTTSHGDPLPAQPNRATFAPME